MIGKSFKHIFDLNQTQKKQDFIGLKYKQRRVLDFQVSTQL